MRIRVTKSAGWYEDKVGEVFEVDESATLEGRDIFFVDGLDVFEYSGNRRYVRAEHAEIYSDGMNNPAPDDVVNSPAHYNYGDIEVIDYIEQVTDSYDGKQAYLAGNIIKYVSRAPHKNGAEDLRKAIWYADRLAEDMERESETKGSD